MRISIRRCLSILRNTSDGNELAMPLPMPWKKGAYYSCLSIVLVDWMNVDLKGIGARAGSRSLKLIRQEPVLLLSSMHVGGLGSTSYQCQWICIEIKYVLAIREVPLRY